MNILYAIKRRKANWIGHIWLLNHAIDAKISVTRKRRKRRKQLLDGLKEKRGYCKLKEKAKERTLWRTRFGSCYGPVVRQTNERVNKLPSAFGWGINNLCDKGKVSSTGSQ